MKVIVNYPERNDDKMAFEERVATFHATLLIEKIKHLNASDISQKEVLNLLINLFS